MSRRRRVGLITTLNTNVGDDLIREGLCLVLRDVLRGYDLEFVPVNKHQPLTVYPHWHPIHYTRYTRHLARGNERSRLLLERFAPKLGLSRFDRCDAIVQCGAPVIWPDCHTCEWAEPLWRQVVGRLSTRTPVLNLAAGSCYPWERQPVSFEKPEEARYVRDILGYCRLTTARDRLSKTLFASLGIDTPHIPCSALLAADDRVGAASASSGIVFINYMLGGGHYEWGQGIDAAQWASTTAEVTRRLRRRHRVAFLCHDQREHDLAGRMDPSIPRVWPRTAQEYFSAIEHAKAALCNRMHAAVALAGIGVPSVAVCTDTRLLMVEAIGLPCVYVKDAGVDQLEADIESLLSNAVEWKERLLALRRDTRHAYTAAVAEVLQSV